MSLKLLRNIVFWSLVFLYLILAPVISFQALGYVFEPKSMSFVKTGIISLVTKPKEASIYLNGGLQKDKTPVAVTRLLPGRYHIDVRLAGYQLWQQEVIIAAEEVARVEHILLIPEKPLITNPVSFPVQFLLPSGEGKFIFLISRESGKIFVRAFDLRKKRVSFELAETEARGNKTTAVSLLASSDERRLLACFKGKSEVPCVAASLSNDFAPVSLSSIMPRSAGNIRFHPKDSKELFYLEDGQLSALSLDEKTKRPVTLKNVRSFEISGDRIYYFTKDFKLFSSNPEGKDAIDLLPDRGLRRLLFGEDETNFYRMFFTERENAFWLRQDGKLLMNRLPYFADENVKGARLVPDSESILYWKSKELWLLNLNVSGKHSQEFFEAGSHKTLLWQSKRPIVSAQMIRGGRYVLIATDRTLSFLELSMPSPQNHFLIVKHANQRNLSFYLDEEAGELYWIDRKDKSTFLCSAKILEPSPLGFSIWFRKPYSSPEWIEL